MRVSGIVVSYAMVPMATGVMGLCAVVSALATFLALRASIHHRIGGTTGDTAGALVELTETSVLVSVAIAASAR